MDADTQDEDHATDAAAERELELAERGDWDALGLDPPPEEAAEAPTEAPMTFTPATISDFLNT